MDQSKAFNLLNIATLQSPEPGTLGEQVTYSSVHYTLGDNKALAAM